MIASIEGVVEEKEIDKVILTNNGIGYLINISIYDNQDIELGKKAKLFIHEQIKEDAYDLFGFTNKSSKELFNKLIGVKNVGPKNALAIMSIAHSDKIRAAIAGGDIVFLISAKGVGKRAAEQIVVELRDKVGLIVDSKANEVVGRKGISQQDEAYMALISLGYTADDATSALSKIDPNLPVDERVKLALKN